MKEHFLKEKGIYYRTNEFREGRQTLVFVHGVSGSSSAWLKYEQKFENEYNILTFDLRGHGKSLKPKKYEEYKIEEFASDLHELIKYLKIEKFVLIAHSFGVPIALAYLQKHLGTVSKIVFLSSNSATGEMLSALIVKPILALAVALVKFFPMSGKAGRHIDYSHYINTGDWNIRRMIADVGNTGVHVYLYGSKQANVYDGEDVLNKINVPTLMIHGKKDSIFPVKYGMSLASKIKGSKLILLDKADHILVLNYFDEVSRAIEEFLADK